MIAHQTAQSRPAPAAALGSETGPVPSAPLIYPPAPDPDGFLRALVIPITNGDGVVVASTIVDPEVYPAIVRWKWYITEGGYIARSRYLPNGGTEKLRLHRVLMACVIGDGLEIDHINRNPLDNRRVNLRISSRAQQMANREPNKSSGVPVVGQLDKECKNGHVRTAENTRINPDGSRRCLICKRANDRQFDARRREARRNLS